MALAEFTYDTLLSLEDRFSMIEVFTPEPRPRSKFAPPGSPDPEPDYQLVFRPCTPGEWDNIKSQFNNERQKAQSPLNLARATVVGVSFRADPVAIDVTAQDVRVARKPVVDAFESLIRTPGFAAVPEAVFATLWEFNGGASKAVEKT